MDIIVKPSLRSAMSVKYDNVRITYRVELHWKKKHEIPLDDNDNVDNENNFDVHDNLDILECTCNVNP